MTRGASRQARDIGTAMLFLLPSLLLIEEVLLGRSSSKDALDAAATELNAALEKYNKTSGK